MNARSIWIYTALRILFFAVPFGILMLLPIGREFWWLSAIFAALIGLSLSVLLLGGRLNDVTTGMAERRVSRTRRPRGASDEDVEDDLAEASGAEELSADVSAQERPEQDRAVGQ
ncbi:hypothetical protein GCM10009808_16900 [Microbacterium sediminicola]|uniref:DUF4229 domain-containing protein n=1 Tax=Microbacterium sediminicola TaxID=415210 RepID=A0ABN2I7G3_9MICO